MKYQYPFQKFIIGTLYGTKGELWKCGWHSGLDLKSINYGGDGKIKPICEGVVQKISLKGGYGKHLYVLHPNGYLSLYAHLSELYVKEGESVTPDTVIGLEGNTGNSTGQHLHLEIHQGVYRYPALIDPQKFLNEKMQEEEKTVEKAQFEAYMAEYEAMKREAEVSTWAKEAWDKTIKQGILDGTAPGAAITREQIAVVLTRLALIK